MLYYLPHSKNWSSSVKHWTKQLCSGSYSTELLEGKFTLVHQTGPDFPLACYVGFPACRRRKLIILSQSSVPCNHPLTPPTHPPLPTVATVLAHSGMVCVGSPLRWALLCCHPWTPLWSILSQRNLQCRLLYPYCSLPAISVADFVRKITVHQMCELLSSTPVGRILEQGIWFASEQCTCLRRGLCLCSCQISNSYTIRYVTRTQSISSDNACWFGRQKQGTFFFIKDKLHSCLVFLECVQ